MLGKREEQEKRATEDEMVGRHHRLNGHEFEQTPGDGEGQGSLACCSPWRRKESDTTDHNLATEQQQSAKNTLNLEFCAHALIQ